MRYWWWDDDIMKLNDKNVASFAVCSSPIDKEGYLSKRGSLNQNYQRRWFVLKGNLLFYFEKKRDREPVGVIVLEHCSVQASEHEKHAFEISFDGTGTRTYVLLADHEEDMTAWIRSISHASYEYLKSIVQELQERLDGLMSSGSGPRRNEVELVDAGVQKLAVSPRENQVVYNGHLMDVGDEETAPHRPPKKLSSGSSRFTYYGSGHSSEEAPKLPPKGKKRSHTTDNELGSSVHFQHPHASPMEQVFPRLQGSATLSPKSSYDHTICMVPEISTMPRKPEPSLIDFDTPQLLPGLSPPALQDKTFEELHQELSTAMQSLKPDH